MVFEDDEVVVFFRSSRLWWGSIVGVLMTFELNLDWTGRRKWVVGGANDMYFRRAQLTD